MYSPPRLLLYPLLFSVGRCRLPNPSDGEGETGPWKCWLVLPPTSQDAEIPNIITLTGWLTVVGMVLRLLYRGNPEKLSGEATAGHGEPGCRG